MYILFFKTASIFFLTPLLRGEKVLHLLKNTNRATSNIRHCFKPHNKSSEIKEIANDWILFLMRLTAFDSNSARYPGDNGNMRNMWKQEPSKASSKTRLMEFSWWALNYCSLSLSRSYYDTSPGEVALAKNHVRLGCLRGTWLLAQLPWQRRRGERLYDIKYATKYATNYASSEDATTPQCAISRHE